MKLDLEAQGGILHLQTNDTDWCHVALQLPDRLIALGAEVRKSVIARLAGGLHDSLVGKIAGVVEGVPVRWVLSLSEEHSTVYAAEVEGSRRLLFQDRDAKWIATLSLSTEERLRWLSLLQRAA